MRLRDRLAWRRGQEAAGPDGDVAFYDDIAYRNDRAYVLRTLERNFSADELQDRTILDYGCGVGDHAAAFVERGAAWVDAVDVGARNVVEARRKLDPARGEVLQADLNDYDVTPGRYDVIWSDTVLELLRRPLSESLRALRRGLKPGGVLYLSLTKKTLANRALYRSLRVLRRVVPPGWRGAFTYAVLPRYWLAGQRSVDLDVVRNKVRYLFIPHVVLYGADELERELTWAGFEVLYLRDRIASDVNSPPHLEVKAIRRR